MVTGRLLKNKLTGTTIIDATIAAETELFIKLNLFVY